MWLGFFLFFCLSFFFFFTCCLSLFFLLPLSLFPECDIQNQNTCSFFSEPSIERERKREREHFRVVYKTFLFSFFQNLDISPLSFFFSFVAAAVIIAAAATRPSSSGQTKGA